MSADNARHGLIHLVRGACGVGSQIQDLLSHVLPALHVGELEEGTHTNTHTRGVRMQTAGCMYFIPCSKCSDALLNAHKHTDTLSFPRGRGF